MTYLRLFSLLTCLASAPAWAVHDGIAPAGGSGSGIVRIDTTDGDNSRIGSCTATVVSASQSRNETWLITAAHCFYGLSWRYQQERRPAPLRVSVAGSSIASDQSQVFVHPSWANDSDPTWFDNLDIALVKINGFVGVRAAGGAVIPEYQRPIYVGGRDYLHDLPAENGFVPRASFCGYGGTGTLTCGLAENLEEDDNYVVVDGRKWIGGTGNGQLGSKFRPGDSGGPFFAWNPALCSRGDRPSVSDNADVVRAFAASGVLVGVVSGPDVLSAWDLELDSYATGTFGLAGWLNGVAGAGTLLTVTANTCDGGDAVVGVRGTGSVIESRFGNARNYELVAPREGRRVVHFYRDNSDPGRPWRRTVAFGGLENYDNASLIQSSYGILEAVVRNGDEITHFWRRSDTGEWRSAGILTRNARGAPAFIQSTFGPQDNFQLVFPREGGNGLVHRHRENDKPGLPWSRVAFFGQSFGRVDAVSLIQSNYGNLEIVFRDGDKLYHMWRHNQNGWMENRTVELPARVRGVPSLIQGRSGSRGNFEVLAPSVVAGVTHLYRDNSRAGEPWIRTTTFARELGQVDGVTLLAGSGAELEAFVYEDNQIFHYRRGADAVWRGPLN
ncbi:MAG: trypsin-like serine protease [Pseudomonadota bacterium]